MNYSSRKVITSYICPDMDGISSMYAYAEYLRKKGEIAEYYFEGTPKKEVGIVLEKFKIRLNYIDNICEDDKIVLVDNNELKFIPKCIKQEQIIQVIDHHPKRAWLNNNKNVDCQIELIGAAATLIAERFKSENMEISKESAILLYYGIISNTMNLKIKLTNAKDIEMAEWLKSKVPGNVDDITKEIFIRKSEIGDNLEEEMEIGDKNPTVKIKWSIGQLEIANAEEFLMKYENKIKSIMDKVSIENDIEYISINIMDILNGYNILIAGNKKTADMLADNFDFFKFNGLKAKTSEFISRKEIVRVISEKYSI